MVFTRQASSSCVFLYIEFIDTVPACTESGATVASPTATCHEHRASITSTIAYFVTEASPESYIVSGSPFYVFGSETGTVGACGANYRLRIIRVLSARCYPNTLRPTCTTSNDRCRSVWSGSEGSGRNGPGIVNCAWECFHRVKCVAHSLSTSRCHQFV